MKWWTKKKEQITESIVESAAGAVKTRTQKAVSNGKKKLEKAVPLIAFGIIVYSVSGTSCLESVRTAKSNFTLYIGNVNIQL